jgi:hypothetical protein
MMRNLIATAIIGLGLLSTAVSTAQAAYDGYPEWARRAFEVAIH